MTQEEKDKIDAMTHRELLSLIRFAPFGDRRMQGEMGNYILKRREELRDKDPEGAVADSKAIGWN